MRRQLLHRLQGMDDVSKDLRDLVEELRFQRGQPQQVNYHNARIYGRPEGVRGGTNGQNMLRQMGIG